MEVPIPLENKCRITDSLELSRVEEKLGKTRARERFESGALDAMTPGTVQTLEPEDTVPQENKNALAKAEQYNEWAHMSKQGLYDQLTSEYGEAFPADAAQYAIDNLQADYKANALEKAKTYYYDMNMSKSGVYDQLISEYGEQFTAEEAQYAIDNLE